MPDTLHLPAGHLPLPRAISSEARAVLGRAYANRPTQAVPSADDRAAWKVFVEDREGPLRPLGDAE